MRAARLTFAVLAAFCLLAPLGARPAAPRIWNFYVDTGPGLAYSEAPEWVSVVMDGEWTQRSLRQRAGFEAWNFAARYAWDIWTFGVSAGASRFSYLAIMDEGGLTRHVGLGGADSEVFNAALSAGLLALRGKAVELGAELGFKWFSYYAITAPAPETGYFENYSMMLNGFFLGLRAALYPFKNVGIFFRLDASGCMATAMQSDQWGFNSRVLAAGSEFGDIAWILEPSAGLSLRL